MSSRKFSVIVRLASTVLVPVLLHAAEARAWDPLQKARRAAGEAQRALADGDSASALEDMLRAQALAPRDPRIRQGLAETYYDTGAFESAIRELEPLADEEGPAHQRRRVLYNAGNAAFRAQDLQHALDLYTEALLSDESAPPPELVHNLELAQRLLEEQPPQQDEQQQGDEGDPQDQQQDQSQQSPGEQEQQQQEQQPPPEEQEQEGQQQQQEQPQDQQPSQGEQTEAEPPTPAEAPDVQKMTPEEAMRLLQALDFDEEELRKSIQRRLRGDEEENEHDW